MLACCGVSDAHRQYLASIPNARSVPNPDGGGICTGIGHTTCYGGGARNSFGSDFDAHGHQWTQGLCHSDSDGDGLSNGVELGDPCCTWAPGYGGLSLMDFAASHPGFPESVPDGGVQAILNQVDCSNTGLPLPQSNIITADSVNFHNEEEEVLSKTYVMERNVTTAETQYISFPFNVGSLDDGAPWQDTLYLVGWTVDVGQLDYVHHVIVFSCPEELPPMLQRFDEHEHDDNPRSDEFECNDWVVIWGPGQDEYSLPHDVAMPLGPGTPHRAFMIQVHYNNVAGVSGVQDRTSVTMHLTRTPRTHEVGILRLGDLILGEREIPAGQASWHFTSRCLILTEDEQDVTLVAHSPHMHLNGRRLWSEKIPVGGDPHASGSWKDAVSAARADHKRLETLGGIDQFDFNSQLLYDSAPRMVLRHGDLALTTCVYNTTHQSSNVNGGLGSMNEMCLHSLFVYPASAMRRLQCIDDDRSVAGPWPTGMSSVLERPHLLEAMLRPNISSQVGFDNTGGKQQPSA
eukprot:jgi/Tetstr1/422233/TSEL_013085.t1